MRPFNIAVGFVGGVQPVLALLCVWARLEDHPKIGPANDVPIGCGGRRNATGVALVLAAWRVCNRHPQWR